MKRRTFLILFLLGAGLAGHPQDRPDTGALIKEFDKVMDFAVQPYVYYTSLTSFRSGSGDSAKSARDTLHGDFYKVGDDLYSGNEQEEMYLQDSLMIRINRSRKTIQLNKVDIASKKKMDVLPLKKMAVQKILREHYTIAAIPGGRDTGCILIRSRVDEGSGRPPGMEMRLLYTRQGYMPLVMEVTLALPRQGSEQGGDIARQTVSISFGAISMTKEKALLMPLWKDKIAYDNVSETYSGKGDCAGYEVIKTF